MWQVRPGGKNKNQKLHVTNDHNLKSLIKKCFFLHLRNTIAQKSLERFRMGGE